jgi:CheY-like chemotaxis protein
MSQARDWDDLAGLRVMILEDDALVAMALEDMLSELGCVIACSVGAVADAAQALRECAIDVAVLDIRAGGSPTYPIADALTARGVPFCFSTGYLFARIDPRYSGHLYLSKPYRPDTLAQTLRFCLSQPPTLKAS